MAKIAIKALAVAALVCLVFDWSHAVDVQQGLGQQGLDLMKDKMADFMKSLATSNSQPSGINQQSLNQGIGQGIGQAIGQQGIDAAKQKMNEFMNSFKQNTPNTQQQQPQQPQQPAQNQGSGISDGVSQGIGQVISQQGLNVAKEKVNELLNSFKQTASESLNKAQNAVREPENTKKVEQQVSSFFNGALSKLKNAFSSSKTTNSADDLTKQEAIKAFDSYADQQSNYKPPR